MTNTDFIAVDFAARRYPDLWRDMLTQTNIDTILRALGVCAAENAANAEQTCNANLRQFYRQKAREYEDAYNAFHKFVGKDPFFAGLDRAIAASAECLDCPDPACSVCGDMKK